jgi:hypothetical protein
LDGFGGYLVVLKKPSHLERAAPRYRGLYRLPYWDQKRYDAGWDDPLWTAEFVDSEGFSPSRRFADRMIAEWLEVYDAADLEVIYATDRLDAGVPDEVADGTFEELGFDVACLRPFYSIVADVYGGMTHHAETFNENGLLASRRAADEYRDEFRRLYPDEEADLYYSVWRVFGELLRV